MEEREKRAEEGMAGTLLQRLVSLEDREDVAEAMRSALEGSLSASGEKDMMGLEPWMVNWGQVSLILQTPEMSAVVCAWDDKLTSYGNAHHCKNLFVIVLKGEVKVEFDGRRKNVIPGKVAMFKEVRKNRVFGKPGSVSVHLFQAEPADVSCHPVKCNCTENQKLVLVNGVFSVTDFERGSSVAKICASPLKDDHLCRNSLRLYTCFRDLIELLHDEIIPLKEGETHSPRHIEKICGLLRSVRIDPNEFGRYLRFKKGAYTRNLVGFDVPPGDGNKAKFTLLVLCWEKGQFSPIHDHAGSSCWVKVLQGRLQEQRFEESEPLKLKSVTTLGPQEVCYINDSQGIHAMGNPDSDQVTVTLHCYAPPYILCRLFDEKSGETKVGSMSNTPIPENPTCDGLELEDFFARVRVALERNAESEIAPLLKRVEFKENQWRELVHFGVECYTRALVALDKAFSLMVLSFAPGQGTPIHQHGSNIRSFVKVLRGSMVLKRFSGTVANPNLVETIELSENSIVDCGAFHGLHMLTNASEEVPAVTVHLHTPPFTQMGYIDSNGLDRVIPVVHSATSCGSPCTSDFKQFCDKVVQRTRNGTQKKTVSEVDSLADLLSFFEQGSDRTIFTNLFAVARFVVIRGITDRRCGPNVIQALNMMRINDEEWSEFIGKAPDKPASSLVARGKEFRLLIRRIDPDPTKQACEEKRASWIKVLDGEIMGILTSSSGEQIHSGTICKHSSAFISGEVSCQLSNHESHPCFILQIVRDTTSA